jgi:hypothetical protein
MIDLPMINQRPKNMIMLLFIKTLLLSLTEQFIMMDVDQLESVIATNQPRKPANGQSFNESHDRSMDHEMDDADDVNVDGDDQQPDQELKPIPTTLPTVQVAPKPQFAALTPQELNAGR